MDPFLYRRILRIIRAVATLFGMACEEEHFPGFLDLPFELRDQIWKEALPKPGFFLVQCQYVETARADQHGDRKTVQLALRPARQGPHDSEYQERVRTNKSLLARCLESRVVVCKRFPDTLDDAGPRLSFREDLIYLDSLFLPDIARHEFPAGVELEFEGGWNELIHRLAFNVEKVHSRPRAGTMGTMWVPRRPVDFDVFAEFLTTCTSLKQLFLTTQWGMSLDLWESWDHGTRSELSSIANDCYGGLTCHSRNRGMIWVPSTYIKGLKSDRYPALKDLEISRMLHIARELRFLCRTFA